MAVGDLLTRTCTTAARRRPPLVRLGAALIALAVLVVLVVEIGNRRVADARLGPVDDLVHVEDPLAAPEVADRVRRSSGAGAEHAIAVVTVPVEVQVGIEGNAVEAQLVQLDFWAAQQADPRFDRVTPSGDTAVLSESLARALGVDPGDEVALSLYEGNLRLEVAGIVPATGFGGLALDGSHDGRNLFVAPGSLEALRSSEEAEPAPVAGVLVVKDEGGEDGPSALRDLDGVAAVEPVRQDLLGRHQVWRILALALGAGGLLLAGLGLRSPRPTSSEENPTT